MNPVRSAVPWWRRKRTWMAFYFGLLLLHHGVRTFDRSDITDPDVRTVVTPTRAGTRVLERSVEVAYRDRPGQTGTPVLFLHGSPGSSRDFEAVVERLPAGRRVLRIDFPGFGDSGKKLPDYSIRSHAAYAHALLDSLGIDRIHLVGMSMGGGVALEMARQRSERVASLAMLASIGVQEFELLGSYEFNHALHAAQLAALWAIDHLVPHFGLLQRSMLTLPYARNFFDSDQRPLRSELESFEAPVLILHGSEDFLVPLSAAREHERIVPQAELVVWEGESHFLVWTRPAEVAGLLRPWFDRVDAGRAAVRKDASEERIDRASRPLPTDRDRRAEGVTHWLLLFLIVLGTFITEDITSVATGLLIAQGRLGAVEAFSAVFCGIYFGDLLLYGVGRLLGITVLRWPPFHWMLDERSLRRGAHWFERRGFWAILLSRFVPGTRLPTYLAAGIVRAGFFRFAFYFFVAVAFWTPLLVAAAVWLGQEALDRFESFREGSLYVFVGLLFATLLVLRVVIPLFTYEGRRRWVGRRIRWRQWEFWPAWRIYLPLLAYVPTLARRHGGVRTVTACNPAYPLGGLVDESKSSVLTALDDGGVRVARHLLVGEGEVEEDLRRVTAFLREGSVDWPLVLKPDRGERGTGVRILKDEAELRHALEAIDEAAVLQEYVPGPEYGVFYVREPGAARGRILSITRKLPLVIEGNGHDDLQRLIWAHPRAVALADAHIMENEDRLDWIPAAGERVVLTQVGTHARGALFVDGRDLWSEDLEQAIHEVSEKFEGFDFGRYDIRGATEEELRRGEKFRVIELNGLSSECTHMYDPNHDFAYARRTLREQWEIAYRIGAARIERGGRPASWRDIVRAWWTHFARQRGRSPVSTRGAMSSPNPS